MNHRLIGVLGTLLGIGAIGAACTGSSEAPRGLTPRLKVLETKPLLIDRLYPSMTGPFEWVDVDVTDLDWVTAMRTDVVDARSGEKLGDEFFCHSQLMQTNGTRLIISATGSEEIRFPDGFALPVGQILSGLSDADRKLEWLGMVLNNHVPRIHQQARVRSTIEYYRDQDLDQASQPMRLYKAGITLEVQDLEAWQPETGPPVHEDVTTHCALVGDFVGHWIVPPGPQRTRKTYRNLFPVDARVHFITGHLHNYSVYMRLIDMTTSQVLWHVDTVYEPERMQIHKIPPYSSTEGLLVHKDHDYAIEALYNNTTDHDIDAMANLDMYYHPLQDEQIFYPEGPGSR